MAPARILRISTYTEFDFRRIYKFSGECAEPGITGNPFLPEARGWYRYESGSRTRIPDPLVFKIAVVVQQIYFRFVNGQTSDPRFANLGNRVAYLAQRARDGAGT